MRLGQITRRLLADGRKALVPFFTAGYPDEATFLDCLGAAARAGCRIVEVGVPFSDPLADGPAIQESSRVALAGGMTLSRAMDLSARAADTTGCSIVLMSYLNPILRLGAAGFAARAAARGIDGAILPDVPLEESGPLRRELAATGVTLIDLVAPTTSQERVAGIVRGADGFLYLVAVTGVTGARARLDPRLPGLVSRVLKETDLPLYVGFGVSGPAQAAAVVGRADGVIIGSALVNVLRAAGSRREAVAAVERFLDQTQAAINGGRIRSEASR